MGGGGGWSCWGGWGLSPGCLLGGCVQCRVRRFGVSGSGMYMERFDTKESVVVWSIHVLVWP